MRSDCAVLMALLTVVINSRRHDGWQIQLGAALQDHCKSCKITKMTGGAECLRSGGRGRNDVGALGRMGLDVRDVSCTSRDHSPGATHAAVSCGIHGAGLSARDVCL